MARLALALSLLLIAVARADPDDRIRDCAERITRLAARGALTAERAWAFDLDAFTDEEVASLAEAAAPLDLPDGARAALRRVACTALFRRGPAGRLGKAKGLCFLLSSPEEHDWLRAYRLLRREPLTADLDEAVTALGTDARPAVRLAAAKLATTLRVFGRDAPCLRATVLACLHDPDPNVAACTAWVAHEAGDKAVIDAMTGRLADDRALDAAAPPFLRLEGWKTVQDVFEYRLAWMSYLERQGRWAFGAPQPGREALWPEGRPEFAALGPDALRAWWKESRENFGFGVPAPQWDCVFDRVIVLDRGRQMRVHADNGMPLKITLKRFQERWIGGRPVTSVDAEILTEVLGEDQLVADVGNPDHDDDYVTRDRATWGDGTVSGECTCRAAFLPTHRKGRVRMKLRVYLGHLGR